MSTQYPAVRELSAQDLRLSRFGVTLFVLSQAVPYFVLINVRIMMAGTYIPPDVDRWLGGLLPTILLVVGVLPAWTAAAACRRDAIRTLQIASLVCVLLGVAAIVTLMIPLFVHRLDALSHYGTIYVTCLGVGAFFTALSTIVTLGLMFRAHKRLLSARTPFGAEASAIVWTFNTAAWVALYVTLQII